MERLITHYVQGIISLRNKAYRWLSSGALRHVSKPPLSKEILLLVGFDTAEEHRLLNQRNILE